MRINLYCIAKKQEEETIIQDYQRMCLQFGVYLEIFYLFNQKISAAQKLSSKEAQISYSKAFEPYLSQGKNIALHPNAKIYDSFEFSQLLDASVINFFIGGAYGFEEAFLQKTQNISLSKLTFSHQIAKIVLVEQVYRGLSILNHHPYHK